MNHETASLPLGKAKRLSPDFPIHDICPGADPYIFYQDEQWHLLVQGDINPAPLEHDGIRGYLVRSAGRIADLPESPAVPIQISSQPDNLHQVWAAEIHFEQYMYVAISNGDNATHRMHVYETAKGAYGPWKYLGRLKAPKEDDYWAIDLTFARIPQDGKEKCYAIWSGWERNVQDIPKEELATKVISQSIYIAEVLSPMEIGPRHLLLSPHADWCSSVEPILEGPQALVIDGEFKGMLLTGNASWTDKYATNVLRYVGGNPLDSSSWAICPEPLFPAGNGIGHGMIVQEENELYFVGHRKTLHEPGWKDRTVFYTPLDHKAFEEYLKRHI